MTDDFVSEALRRAADLLPDSNDRLAGVRRKRTARVRRRATAAVGLLAVVGSGTAFGLTRGDGSSHPTVVADDGSTELTATGRVVQVPGKPPRFCANVADTLMLVDPKPPPAWCPLGVDVRGVDLAAVEDRYEKAGAVEGRATLTGHLDGDVLVVTQQQPPQPDPGPAFNVDPPCTPPAGGWRDTGPDANPDMTAAQQYQARHPDEVADIAVARPSKTQALPYVLTWGDPGPVRAALRGAYGDQLCVLQSRWTRAVFTAAQQDLTGDAARMQANGVYAASGRQFGLDGQLSVCAEAVRSTPELEAIVARHPAGLVRIDYWLHPVS